MMLRFFFGGGGGVNALSGKITLYLCLSHVFAGALFIFKLTAVAIGERE